MVFTICSEYLQKTDEFVRVLDLRREVANTLAPVAIADGDDVLLNPNAKRFSPIYEFLANLEAEYNMWLK